MRLKNKKTGEVDDFIFEVIKDRIDLYRRVGHSDTKNTWHYNSLAELNEEWEDYEEPKSKYLYVIDPTRINFINDVYKDDEPDWCEQALALGIGFKTKEEAEKAAEKLKALKRLKDHGFKFVGKTYETDTRFGSAFYQLNEDTYSEDVMAELDLLFGGEE